MNTMTENIPIIRLIAEAWLPYKMQRPLNSRTRRIIAKRVRKGRNGKICDVSGALASFTVPEISGMDCCLCIFPILAICCTGLQGTGYELIFLQSGGSGIALGRFNELTEQPGKAIQEAGEPMASFEAAASLFWVFAGPKESS